MYMYYFEIDKSRNFETSKSIDMGTLEVDRDANIFEKLAGSNFINLCKNSIRRNSQDTIISTFMYFYVVYKYVKGLVKK